MITAAAERIAQIENDDVRDLLAYALDEGVHSWRCSFLGDQKECNAIHDAFSDLKVEDSAVKRALQPTVEFLAWYIHSPLDKLISRFQDWGTDSDGPPRWRISRKAFSPWGLAPKPRNEFSLIARLAATRTWYSADGFIAAYTAATARRLIKDSHGVPAFFVGSDYDPDDDAMEIGIICYNYSLQVLAETAEAIVEYKGDDDAEEIFPDMLAEAMRLGLLWD